jgi:glycosyltransferase involved in cell wall biosynthesis
MISIIIPTLNEESVIEKTLQGLKKFDAFQHEIIVSDGNSQDATIEIAKKHADKVIVYEGKERQTIGGGRNLGARSASGKYLLFLDADMTLLDANALIGKILAEFEKDEKLLGATVSLRVLKEFETLADKILSIIFLGWVHYLTNNVFKTGSASGEFQFIRKSAFEELGGYDERLPVAEDNDLFMRMAKIGKTRMFFDLKAYHTGRRFHKLGWPKVLWDWNSNLASMKLFKRSASKEWEQIR